MANHSLPTQSSTYVNFVTELDARFDDVCLGLDPARTTMTNLPTNSVGWSSAGNKWQRWTGSAWTDLATTYNISINGNAATATQLQTSRNINGVSFNGTTDINIPTQNSLTFSNTGGAPVGTVFNGSAAATISYETVGAPSITGANASGIWNIAITGNAASVTNGVYTAGDQQVNGIKTFQVIRETRVAGGIGGSYTINLSNGNYFTRTFNAAATITITNAPASGTCQSFIFDITNGGSYTITWPTSIDWPDGTAPGLTGVGRDVLGFFTHNGGTTWTGLILGLDVK